MLGSGFGFFKYQIAFVASLDVKTFRGVKDTDTRADPRTRCGGTSGGDEG